MRRSLVGLLPSALVGALLVTVAWLRRFFKRDPFWKFRNNEGRRDRLVLRSRDTRIRFVARD